MRMRVVLFNSPKASWTRAVQAQPGGLPFSALSSREGFLCVALDGEPVQALLDVSRTFLDTARRELETGLSANDHVKIRQAAEKAWNAVVQATDYAMYARGTTPVAGREAHRDRRDFLERIGRWDLAQKYTYFAERLHGDVFYSGAEVSMEALRRYLDEVGDYIPQVSTL